MAHPIAHVPIAATMVSTWMFTFPTASSYDTSTNSDVPTSACRRDGREVSRVAAEAASAPAPACRTASSTSATTSNSHPTAHAGVAAETVRESHPRRVSRR